MDTDRNEDIENGRINEPGHCRPCLDFGKKRTRQANACESSDHEGEDSIGSDEEASV